MSKENIKRRKRDRNKKKRNKKDSRVRGVGGRRSKKKVEEGKRRQRKTRTHTVMLKSTGCLMNAFIGRMVELH